MRACECFCLLYHSLMNYGRGVFQCFTFVYVPDLSISENGRGSSGFVQDFRA